MRLIPRKALNTTTSPCQVTQSQHYCFLFRSQGTVPHSAHSTQHTAHSTQYTAHSTHTYTHTRTHTRTHTHVYTHMYTHTCTHTHVHTHAHTQTHTQTKPDAFLFLDCVTSHTKGWAKTIFFIRIYGVHTVFLAGKSPYKRSYTVCIHGSGQPYTQTKRPHRAAPCLCCPTRMAWRFCCLTAHPLHRHHHFPSPHSTDFR